MWLFGTMDELLGGRCALKEEDGRDMLCRREDRRDGMALRANPKVLDGTYGGCCRAVVLVHFFRGMAWHVLNDISHIEIDQSQSSFVDILIRVCPSSTVKPRKKVDKDKIRTLDHPLSSKSAHEQLTNVRALLNLRILCSRSS